MSSILEIPIKKKFSKEKDTYPYLKKYVFDEAVKIYTPVLCGFPDFLAVSYKEPYNETLKAGFVEVKLDKGRLSIHQEIFLTWLSKGFTVYVFHIKTISDGSVIQIKEVEI
jgi:hypothetical protein